MAKTSQARLQDQDWDMFPEGAVGTLPPGTADATLRSLFPEENEYSRSPEDWIADRLGEFTWSKQVDICQSVVNYRYTGVKACHGPGKSYIAARLACWWLDPLIHDLGSAFVVTTAPTWPQVQAILWREIRRAHRAATLPGRTTLDCRWYMGEGRSDEELIAMGRKPADYNEQAFQGLHAEHILIILDEGSGIPTQLWNAVETLMTNEDARLLAIGNPDDPSSDFAKKCKHWEKQPDCNVIRISAFDTPNFTGEPVPDKLRRALTSQQWVNDRRKDWGEDSPLWVAKVLGEFPDTSDDYLITPAMLNRAYSNDLPGLATGRYALDVARMGADKTVLYRNRDGQIRFVTEWAKKDTYQSSVAAKEVLDKHIYAQEVPIVVDMIGVGAGVYDNLYHWNYEAGGFQGSERALNHKKFYNRRAEVYWLFREGLELGLWDLDPDDEVLAGQLTSIKWWINLRGQIQLETKDDMRERGLESPNRADACVMSTVHVGLHQGAIEREVDPLESELGTDDILQKVM